MDILEQFVQSLSKEEVRFFKLFSTRTSSEKERKDLLLFDSIRKQGDEWVETKIFSKIYPKQTDKNAFYRLKNRLLDDLSKSVLLQHIDSEDELQAFSWFSLGKWFVKNGKKKLAIYFFRKSEKKAIDLELYELLDMLYGEFIRLSHEEMDVDALEFIKLRRDNQRVILGIRQLEEILASFSYKMIKSQGYANLQEEMNQMESLLIQLQQETLLLNSSKIQLKLYHAVSRALLQQQNFVQLETVLRETWKRFSENQLFQKLPEETPLEMLTFLVNTLFKNQKYQESLEFAEILNKYLDTISVSLKSKYLFFYYNSLVINYSVLDKPKALQILVDLENRPEIQVLPFYGNFIYLNQALLLYQLHNIKDAIKRISNLYMHSGYENTDVSLRCKISMIEILFRVEIEDYEYLEYRIPQFQREFDVQLKNPSFIREKELVSIIKMMIIQENYFKNPKVQKRIHSFMQIPSAGNEIVSYQEWIQKFLV